jgi:hypothetical protein
MAEAMNNGAMFYIQKSGNPRPMFTELEDKIREASQRYRAEGTLYDAGSLLFREPVIFSDGQ